MVLSSKKEDVYASSFFTNTTNFILKAFRRHFGTISKASRRLDKVSGISNAPLFLPSQVQRYKEYSLPLLRTKPFENITFPDDLRENITVNIVDTNEIWMELEIR